MTQYTGLPHHNFKYNTTHPSTFWKSTHKYYLVISREQKRIADQLRAKNYRNINYILITVQNQIERHCRN